jgi:molybdopterin-containing oxidoreductase family membrane subunit
MGLIPDLATLRDRATTRGRQFWYGLAALGWTGSARQWHRFEKAYVLLAALATPLVLSVHTVVSFDFAVSQLPGWHTTIFPPYFVAGAVFSGFAMVVTLIVPARAMFGLKQVITIRHLENMTKIMLATGSIVGFAYGIEFFIAWYSGNQYEYEIFRWRAVGTYAIEYWIMVIFNTIVPLLLFVKKIRTSLAWLVVICIMINIGMWFERYVIIVTSLAHDFLPYAWGHYKPSLVEFGITIGSFGWFFLMFFIFAKHLPSVAITELKEMIPYPKKKGGHA